MARRKLGFWYRLAVAILKPLLTALTKRDWRGVENLHTGGGIVLAPNHVSYFDPLVLAHFLHDNRRPPRFLAKAGLFDIFFVGQVLRGAGQIPVYRMSKDAAHSFRDAVAGVQRGECVVVYPEGTVTRDPGLWPMTGKTGAARIALATGAPVVPVAQWGPQEVLAPYARRPHLLPRKTMHMVAGPPVDLSEFQGQPVDGELLRAATAKIMDAIAALLEEVRGETAPPERFDMRTRKVPETGNPNKPRPSGAAGVSSGEVESA